MKLNDKRPLRGGGAVLLAFGVNALFLAFMLLCFRPAFEGNDDVLLGKFVDGQLSHKSAYVPFINIGLGWLLKTLYTLGGDGLQWYCICEYAVLFLGFTAATWTLLRRFRPFPALVLTGFMLFSMAADCYLSMNFSKPSGVGTAGGLCLMLYALRNETGRVLRLPLGLGMGLCVLAFMWRFETFFTTAAIMAGVGLLAVADILEESRGEPIKLRLGRLLRYALPFAVLLAIVGTLYGVNTLDWNTPEYKAYTEFDWIRSVLIDFEVPSYETMPQVYDSLNMDADAVELFKGWNFYDTEKFTAQSLQAIVDARGQYVSYSSLGECLGIFLDKCILYFYECRPLAGFLLTLALFVACGRRRARDWLAAFWLLGAFFAIYMAFIYLRRYPVNRIEISMFMAMALGLSFVIAPERLEGECILCALLLALSLLLGYRSCREVCLYDSHNSLEDKSAEKAAVDLILQDTEHLYFVKYLSMDHVLYSPLEPAPAGYADRIVFIGGYSCRHPEIVRVLERYGVENPSRDIVGSDSVYIIDNDIERTLRYINKYYDPDARAERVEPESTETALNIYRILE